MFQEHPKWMFLLLKKAVYIIFLGLGMYFIYQGRVLQRFYGKKTAMGYMEEDLRELPTFVTYISGSKSFELGKDFHIEYRVKIEGKDQGHTNLTHGDNTITEGRLGINLDGWPNINGGKGLKFGRHWKSLKLTPLNFPRGLRLDYIFRFIFEDPTAVGKSKISMDFRTKNGVLPCGGKYHDGLSMTATSGLGERKMITVKAEKRVLLQETNANCRTEPYTDLFNDKFLFNLQKNCANLCRQSDKKIYPAHVSRGVERTDKMKPLNGHLYSSRQGC